MSTENSNQKPEVLVFMEELVEKTNKKIKAEKKKAQIDKERRKLVNSYGAIMLNNNTIVNIKYNFYFLEQFWLQWVYAKELGMEEELQKLKEATNGGLFNAGDIIFKLDDIKLLFKPEEYYNSSEMEQENIDMKNTLIYRYVSDSIFSTEVYYEEDDDE